VLVFVREGPSVRARADVFKLVMVALGNELEEMGCRRPRRERAASRRPSGLRALTARETFRDPLGKLTGRNHFVAEPDLAENMG